MDKHLRNMNGKCGGVRCTVNSSNFCHAKHHNWVCTLPKGHNGDHVACWVEDEFGHDAYNWSHEKERSESVGVHSDVEIFTSS